MSIRSRIEKTERAFVKRIRRESAALELANDLVQFQVEAEVLHLWSDKTRQPDDPRQVLLAIGEIWKREAYMMSVPNDSTVERRIASIYNHFIRSPIVKEPEQAGSLIEKLAS